MTTATTERFSYEEIRGSVFSKSSSEEGFLKGRNYKPYVELAKDFADRLEARTVEHTSDDVAAAIVAVGKLEPARRAKAIVEPQQRLISYVLDHPLDRFGQAEAGHTIVRKLTDLSGDANFYECFRERGTPFQAVVADCIDAYLSNSITFEGAHQFRYIMQAMKDGALGEKSLKPEPLLEIAASHAANTPSTNKHTLPSMQRAIDRFSKDFVEVYGPQHDYNLKLMEIRGTITARIASGLPRVSGTPEYGELSVATQKMAKLLGSQGVDLHRLPQEVQETLVKMHLLEVTAGGVRKEPRRPQPSQEPEGLQN